VRSRTVFFLSGFDPKGAAHYHALYRDEAARQAGAGGLSIETGPRRRLDGGDACWSLSASTPSGPVSTRYHFMRWDDIVRQHWPRRSAELWFEVVRTNLFNLRHGALWRMLASSWPPVLVLVAPFVLLLGVALGLPLLWTLAFWLFSSLGWGVVWSGLAGLIPAGGLLWVARKLEGRLSMSWLMRSYAFNRRQALGQTPELEQRLDQHAATLLQRVRQAQDDEVLLVGHSSGAIMAVAVLARALKLDPALGCHGPRVALLTLGHWIPLLGCLPQAGAFRSELRELGCAREIDWIDFTAPPDGCCFALVDPLVACGVERTGSATDRPKLLSPRFMNMFEPERYRKLRRDKFRVHFQYLMASDKPTGYDYFAITAGDQTLAARFAGQPSITDFTGLRLFKRGPPASRRNG
jgi:pimeloyl-ACP methyl ester carboxylesterase